MKRTKKALTIALALVLLIVPLAALADGTITILAGALGTSLDDFAFPDAAFSFTDTLVVSADVLGTVNDTDGLPDGWHLTILASDFETVPLAADGWPVTALNGAFSIGVGGADYARTAGVGGIPSDPITGFVAMDSVAPLTFISCDPLNACGPGDGEFDMSPSFEVIVPGGTAPDSYTSAITVDILLGP